MSGLYNNYLKKQDKKQDNKKAERNKKSVQSSHSAFIICIYNLLI